MFKKFIILFLLCIFTFSFTTPAKAINDDELIPFIGKEVTIGVSIEFENSCAIIKIKGKLLNVVNGMEFLDNPFAGYYAILEYKSQVYPIPCKVIVYINEIKIKENKNDKV